MQRLFTHLLSERERQYWDSIYFPSQFLEPSALLSTNGSHLARQSNIRPIKNHFGREEQGKFMPLQKQQQPIPLRCIKINKESIKGVNDNFLKTTDEQSSLKDCCKKEEQMNVIKTNNKLDIIPSTSKIEENKEEKEDEDDECLIIYQNISKNCFFTEKNDSRKKIKSEEIDESYLKKILKEEKEEEEEKMNDLDTEELILLDEEYSSGEDLELKDVDLNVEIGDNDLENTGNILMNSSSEEVNDETVEEEENREEEENKTMEEEELEEREEEELEGEEGEELLDEEGEVEEEEEGEEEELLEEKEEEELLEEEGLLEEREEEEEENKTMEEELLEKEGEEEELEEEEELLEEEKEEEELLNEEGEEEEKEELEEERDEEEIEEEEGKEELNIEGNREERGREEEEENNDEEEENYEEMIEQEEIEEENYEEKNYATEEKNKNEENGRSQNEENEGSCSKELQKRILKDAEDEKMQFEQICPIKLQNTIEITKLPFEQQKIEKIEKKSKKPLDKSYNFLTSPQLETLIEVPTKKIKKIPLTANIKINDPRLEDIVNYGFVSKCAEEGLLLPNFKIIQSNLCEEEKKLNFSKNKKNVENSVVPMDIEMNEDNYNNRERENNNAGQSSSEGQLGPRLHQPGLVHYQHWENQHWRFTNPCWSQQNIPPPPMPPPLNAFYPPPPDANNTMSSISQQQNEIEKRAFDSLPRKDSRPEMTTSGANSSENASQSSQTVLQKNIEHLEDLLKRKSDEVTSLRSQMAKKDEEYNKLKSVEVSYNSMSERLDKQLKINFVCKATLAEKEQIIKNQEDQIKFFKEKVYELELKEKNNSTLKEATSLNKLENENKLLNKQLKEQQESSKKSVEEKRILEVKCKKLTNELQHNTNKYISWREDETKKHKKELKDEINKINQKNNSEKERIAAENLASWRISNVNELQSKIFKKDAELARLTDQLDQQHKNSKEEAKRAAADYRNLEDQCKRNEENFEQNKKIELDKQKEGFNQHLEKLFQRQKSEMEKKYLEVSKLKQSMNENLKREQAFIKKYEELLAVIEQLKADINNNGSKTTKINAQNVEKDLALNREKALNNISHEQNRIKIKKEQLDNSLDILIKNKQQQCENCPSHLIAIKTLKNALSLCKNSGCNICSQTDLLEGGQQQQQLLFTCSTETCTSSNNINISPKTPPKANNGNSTLRKTRKRPRLNSTQGFNNSAEIEQGRQTADSFTSSSISMPPIDPKQTTEDDVIFDNEEIKIEETERPEAVIAKQLKIYEDNARCIRSNPLVASFTCSDDNNNFMPSIITTQISDNNQSSSSRLIQQQQQIISVPQPLPSVPQPLQSSFHQQSICDFRSSSLSQINNNNNSVVVGVNCQMGTSQVFQQQQPQQYGIQQNYQPMYSSQQLQQRQFIQQQPINVQQSNFVSNQQQQQLLYPHQQMSQQQQICGSNSSSSIQQGSSSSTNCAVQQNQPALVNNYTRLLHQYFNSQFPSVVQQTTTQNQQQQQSQQLSSVEVGQILQQQNNNNKGSNNDPRMTCDNQLYNFMLSQGNNNNINLQQQYSGRNVSSSKRKNS